MKIQLSPEKTPDKNISQLNESLQSSEIEMKFCILDVWELSWIAVSTQKVFFYCAWGRRIETKIAQPMQQLISSPEVHVPSHSIFVLLHA